jgi:hypothetical protein
MVQTGGKMNEAVAKDLIELVNSLKDFVKSKSVSYNKTTFDYVPLDDILDRIKQNNKWAVLQPLSVNGQSQNCVETWLVHQSGEVIKSGQFELLISEHAKPQDMGAVITYTKRYQLGSFLGLSTETDNDANFESEVVEQKATPKQVEMLSKAYTGENLLKLLEANNITQLKDMPMKKASELIGKIVAKSKI